jgi:hypothetical protein
MGFMEQLRLSAPPHLDVEQLMTLLAGLLGFDGMRSFEKRGALKGNKN